MAQSRRVIAVAALSTGARGSLGEDRGWMPAVLFDRFYPPSSILAANSGIELRSAAHSPARSIITRYRAGPRDAALARASLPRRDY